MNEVERPTHRVRITARGDGEMVIISVSDTGRGVPGDQLELNVQLKRTLRGMAQYECSAVVAGKEVASAEILCAEGKG